MVLLRMFLWILFLPMGVVSIGVVISLFDRDVWSQPKPFLRFLLAVLLVLPGLSIGYALLVDWAAVEWVGVSFLLFVVGGVILGVGLLGAEGFSFDMVKANLRSASRQIRDSEKIVGKARADTAACSGDKVQRLSPFRKKLSATDEQSGWRDCAGVLRKTIAAELCVLAAGLLLVSWVPPTGYGSLLLALSILAVCAHYTERILAPGLEIAKARGSEQFAQRAGVVLVLLGNFLVALLFLDVLVEMVQQVSATSSATPASSTITLLAGLGLVFLTCGRSLLRLHPPQAAPEVLEADHRAPVLYLRSFARESQFEAMRRKASHGLREIAMSAKLLGLTISAARAERAGRDTKEIEDAMERFVNSHLARNLYGRLTAANAAQSFTSGRSSFFDEQLFLANLFEQIGPYVAIKRPKRRRFSGSWSDVGSAKLSVPDSQWQETVLGLLRLSSIVVVEAGSSTGLLWELAQVVSLVSPRKVLLIVPERESEFRRFCKNSLSIFPVALPAYTPDMRFVMFDDRWKPTALHGEDVLEEGSLLGVQYVALLEPFLERNGFKRLASRRTSSPPTDIQVESHLRL